MNLDRNSWICAGRAAFALTLVLAVGCGDDGSGTDEGASDTSTAPNTGTDTNTDTGATTPPTTSATDTTDTGEEPTGTGSSTGETPVTVDYMADIQPIWDMRCVEGCHIETGSAQTNGPILTAAKSYAALVDVPSPTVNGINQVEPGDTAKSYLWLKLNGEMASVGGLGLQMPQGGMLTEEQLGKVEAWIVAGAKP